MPLLTGTAPACSSSFVSGRDEPADDSAREPVPVHFSLAVPLGANCLPAAWMQSRGMRKAAMPFDWTFTSPAMVRDCLNDDFRAFLDPREYVAIGKRGAGAGHRRYSDMRLPGRWRGFTFLHHDPLRKRQDQDYFQRCVQRFRQATRSPGRKLFAVCCLVDSQEGLQQLRAGGEAATVTGSQRLGEGASWKFFSPAEVSKLFEALLAYGADDFHLAAVVLCVGAASECAGEPKLIPVDLPSTGQTNATGTVVMQELHLSSGSGADLDPFKFFGDLQNEQAFAAAVLGSNKDCFQASGEVSNFDGYLPSGYRDMKVDQDVTSAAVESFTCRWCGAGGFQSRNRLFAHIRSTPACAAAVSHDAQGLASLASSRDALQICAFHVGVPPGLDWTEAVQSLQEALLSAGAGELRWMHGETLGQACPVVGASVVASFSAALAGDALLELLHKALRKQGGQVALHASANLPRGRVADLQGSRLQNHFAYLLPFHVLHAAGDSLPSVDGERSAELESGSWQRRVYRDFKEALRAVQKLLEYADADGDPEVDQVKMVERLTFHQDYVVVRISGRATLDRGKCLSVLSACVATCRSWLPKVPAVSGLPDVPSHLLYLEGHRLQDYEKHHGPLLGEASLPWGGGSAPKVSMQVCGSPAEKLVQWRSALQAKLAEFDAEKGQELWAAWTKRLNAACEETISHETAM